MRSLEKGFHDRDGYLERLGAALQEKLKIAQYISPRARSILDVGCADGTVTKALAHLFPRAEVMGIDLDDGFIAKANEGHIEANASFERKYLRDILDSGRKFDHVSFVSVLHEIYHYNEGRVSVRNAISAAYEMLEPGGKILIRDMMLPEGMKKQTFTAENLMKKVRANQAVTSQLADFERTFGEAGTLDKVNHFLLKYMYTENWERELPENYVPLSREWYEVEFHQLGVEQLEAAQSYLIPFLREKWKADFGFTDEETSHLTSTTLIVAQKPF